MVGRRALVLLLVSSLLAAGIPKPARAAELSNAAVGVAGAFVNSLLRDPELQQLLRSVTSELPPSIKEQLEQIAQLAVSGATPDDITQQLELAVSSLPEETKSNIKQLISRLSYVAGFRLMAGAVVKFKQDKEKPTLQHKDNPTPIPIGTPIALSFIAAALLFLPSILSSGGGTLFGDGGTPNTRFVDNSDGTITDNQTGLMWEKKSGGASTSRDGQGVGNCLHCVNDTYTWAAAMSEWLSAVNGRTYVGSTQTGYAGHSDWRLPTIVELQTILLEPFPCSVSPCVNAIFNDSDSFTAASFYWSSTSFAASPNVAWSVLFLDGTVVNMTDKSNNALHVRAVRGAQ